MNMQIAHIAPYNALNQVSSLGDIEFCLAPYALTIPEYKQYFIKAKSKGRFIILDNGVAEDVLISDDKLVKLAIELKVDELVIPDVIGDYKKTKTKRIKFLDKYYQKLKDNNIKLMSVIQGKSIIEYQRNYAELLIDDRIATVGIPFRMMYANFALTKSTKEGQCYLNRVIFVGNYARGYYKPIHLLGCNLPIEMIVHSRMDLVRSMDSKLMMRYGMSKKMFTQDDFQKPKQKVYIDKAVTNDEIDIAVKNIEKLQKELGWLINKK